MAPVLIGIQCLTVPNIVRTIKISIVLIKKKQKKPTTTKNPQNAVVDLDKLQI